MAKNIDFNEVMEKVKKFFNDLPENMKKWSNDFNKWLNDLPQNMKKWWAEFQVWVKNLPENTKKLIEKIKNYPPDKQAAVGAIGLGFILVITSIFMFIF
ncbi:hypothetical protein C0585_04910 [Candidatus Woesearchaeota archaeon]|nr:MAG: hypothetical protein C0585_04910 [Candidatus Woesearchaeota archaeon]